MEYVQTQNKIRLLFKKILEPGYVMDNYYADQLIDKMRNCAGDPEIAFLESVPLVSDLIIESFTCKENSHTSVKVFLTRMLALTSQRELHFAKIFAKNGENVLKEFKEINTPTMSPSLRVAYMELALALAQHDSGIVWLLQTGIWKEVLGLCNEKQTVFVVRQTYKFAAKFLWKINDMGDDTNVKLVISHILKPVSQIEFLKLDSVTSEEEEQILKIVEPMLQILLLILTESHRIEQPSLIINNFQQQSIISHMYIMFDRMRKEDTTLLIARIMFWLVLAKMFSSKPFTPDVVYGSQDLMDLSVTYFNIIHQLISRRSATLVLDYCNNCNLILTTVWKDKKYMRDNKEVDMQKQSLFLCLVPTLVFVTKCKHRLSEMTNEGLCELTIKMLNTTCEHTARAAYALRDLTLELDMLSVTLHSVKRLTCLKSHLNDEQANLVFQVLFYVLKKFDPTESDSVEDELMEESQDKVNVMTYVLDIVLYLVKNYNINWRESLEVICLYNVVYCLLKRPNLSCKFLVTALNVITVTVKKFLQPNLSLLMESRPGSAIDELGQLVYTKLHDRSWEVRDSALELLLVCTEISFIKFPPFQKQITENKLINVATTLALNDYEFYVQASALKCIGAASKIPFIWEELRTQYPDIQDQIISFLRNNQEGIARKEACAVLCDLYQNLKLSAAFKQTLYEHMVSTALADFHWEVQLSALKFWRMVIQSLLSDQGMLDGTFPPVTFSRETRKIVTLNEAEIQKRLIRILDKLSSVGCLTVLVKLLHEDTELDIMETALNISLELLNILNQYKVPDVLKPVDDDVRSIDELLSNIVEEESNRDEDITEPESSAKSANVIEGILNSDDINLLANIYERHMSLYGNKTVPTSEPKIKLLKHASPHFFINYLKGTDFKAVLEQKKTWKNGIRSVSSLLDDVLGIYEMNDDINTMDCY